MTRSHDQASPSHALDHPHARDEAEMSPALRAMVDELRTEAPRELPWDAMERRLLDRIARGEGGDYRPDRSGAALRQVAGFAAAAALLALLVSAGGKEPAATTTTTTKGIERSARVRVIDARAVGPAPSRRGDRDLAALRPGDAVEAGDRSISFARPGDVRFTLATGSRAVLSSAGPLRTVIELERGAIRAEVEPRNPAEGILDAFVVEAGGTRVAVRGTAFSVERAADSILVDVEHGTVAVGPAGRAGVLMATSLVGPARASFSLSGVRLATLPPGGSALFETGATSAEPSEPLALLAPPAPSPSSARPEAPPSPAPANESTKSAEIALPPARPPAPSEPPTPPPPAAPEPSAPPAPPAPDTAPQAEPPSFLTPASIKAGVERCFNQIYSSRPAQVKLSIASTMRIQVRADGTVQSAAFDPPLAPSFQLCAGSAIAGRFQTGPQTVTIPVTFGR
jgi:ferric-dicitrate binding protein FerR (iron transport regulator)